MKILIHTSSQLVGYAQSVSHMKNFRTDVLPKYLCAKMWVGVLPTGVFVKLNFFFAPIILNMFQNIADRVIARGMVI